MSQFSIAEMELQRRAFGQYLNYLVNHRVKGTKTISNPEIPIDTEIANVSAKIQDLKSRIATERTKVEA